MASIVIMPKQGLMMEEGTLTNWLKKEGEVVTAGEPLFEMETDKLTITMIAAAHIAGKPCKQLNYNHIPSCVYCNPETAMVGLTEEQACATGKEIGVGTFNLSGNGKALTMGENEGFVKLIFDKATEEILGCHIIGPRATDLAAEAAAVMECEGTISEVGSTVHPHPTVSEVLMEAAHACHGNCVNAPKIRK